MPASADSTILIAGTRFENNIIGLHVLGTQHLLDRCIFRNNLRYGIKEDENGNPVIKGCEFEHNLFDYYDEYERIISIQRLNQLNNTTSNTSDK
jgi:hypothetical protein